MRGPLTVELPRLHVMLLWSTGWEGGHVHEFVFSDDHYGAKEPGWTSRTSYRQELY